MKGIMAGCCALLSALYVAVAAAHAGATDVQLSPTPPRLQSLSNVEALPPPVVLENTYQLHEATPGPVATPPTRSAEREKGGDEQIRAEALISAITPLCPTLAINTTYTLSGTATGGSYCYHFQITQRAKTQVFLIAQNASTNFALTLVRHEEDDTLTILGTSDQPANANEILLALTAPGHYYWLMDANASDGSAFQFGALVNTAADAYELNDTVGLSTSIPNDRSELVGNMDSAQDVDYFNFVAQNGQNLIFILRDSYGLNEWKLEYYTGSSWVAFMANRYYILSGVPVGFALHFRISPAPGVTVNSSHTYAFMAGSQVMSSDMVNVGSSETLVRIPSGYTDPYLTTQAHNQLSWSIRVLDSNGAPVKGAVVNFNYRTEDIALRTQSAISNASGIASSVVSLPDCTGNWTVTFPWAGNSWRTEFDFGDWNIKVPGANDDEVGVGGRNYPAVALGHICRQTLQ